MGLLLLFVGGLAALLVGAELLVRGASRLALALGITPLVVGLTVVAMGTSAPELAISLGAALRGTPDLAMGNIIGSNIANVLLILGLVAVITPLVVARQLVRLDVPVMLAASLAVFWMALDGRISRSEGLLLVGAAIAYILLLLRAAKRAPEQAASPALDTQSHAKWKLVLFMVAGLLLLVLGARWLVDAATQVATALGLSDLVIGLTVVAIGTSLPEIATSIMSAVRGERDLAVGNVVGSNIVNLLLVLGLTAIVASGGVPVSRPAINLDLPVMVAVAVACLPIFFTGHCIKRWEGVVFLGYYVAYTVYLLLGAQGHDALEDFRIAMTWFVIPLTVLTLAVSLGRALQSRRRAAPKPLR